MKVLYYIAGVFSVFALGFYSLPWTYGATHTALGFYIIAFFWFMFAWLPLIFHLVLGITEKVRKNKNWKHHIITSGLIVISYILLFIAMSNGYMVTV